MGTTKGAGLRLNADSLGVAAAAAILLIYGLFRPGSLAFSIPFLIAPAVILLWTVRRSSDPAQRHGASAVTAATALGIVIVVLINTLR